ncbi:MAG TPA: hypothetical protein VI541_05150, partial [Actinomycetota bacterium]|nr:hypothetical protein [Actinomycetota bacterium]
GKVRLAELSTEAQTWAKGRRGSADSSFDRRIVGLQVDADGDGVFEDVCDVCSVDAAREAMNRALIGVGSVDFPSPDGEYLDGSPGGFQAVVEKDRHQFYADRALNDDDSQAVVGLMFFLQSDARAGRSRQIVQIAGVQAESHYGIYLLPTAASSQREEVRNDLLERVIERVPATPDPPAPPPSLPIKAKEIIDRFVERVAQGWRVFVAKPGDALLMAALLSFLLLPLYLVSRRRELGS